MAITDINSEDRLVQKTFAEHLEKVGGPLHLLLSFPRCE